MKFLLKILKIIKVSLIIISGFIVLKGIGILGFPLIAIKYSNYKETLQNKRVI